MICHSNMQQLELNGTYGTIRRQDGASPSISEVPVGPGGSSPKIQKLGPLGPLQMARFWPTMFFDVLIVSQRLIIWIIWVSAIDCWCLLFLAVRMYTWYTYDVVYYTVGSCQRALGGDRWVPLTGLDPSQDLKAHTGRWSFGFVDGGRDGASGVGIFFSISEMMDEDGMSLYLGTLQLLELTFQ